MAQTVSYRNGRYQGCCTEDRKRHGFGMLISDESEVLLAFWKHGVVEGLYCYLGSECNAYGTMKEGRLTGFNVIESVRSTVYGRFVDNLLHGMVVFRYPELVEVVQYCRGEVIAINKSEEFTRELFLNILGKHFPDQRIGLIQFLSFITSEAEPIEGMTFREVRTQSSYKFYGFLEGKNKEGLGVKFRNESLLSCGEFCGNELFGWGRLYCSNNQIQDGLFGQGLTLEEGLIFSRMSNKFTVVDKRGRRHTPGLGNPLRPIKKLRYITHLQAVDFCDCFVLIDKIVRVKLSNITKSKKQEITFRAKSPVRAKDASPKKMQRLLSVRHTFANKILRLASQNELFEQPYVPQQHPKKLIDDSGHGSEMDDFFGDPETMKQQMLNILQTTSQKTQPQKELSRTDSAKSPNIRTRSPTEFKKP